MMIFAVVIKVPVYHSIVDPVRLQSYSSILIKVLNAGPLVCLARSWNVKRTKCMQSARHVYRAQQTKQAGSAV